MTNEPTSLKEAIRTEVEQTRTDYHALLRSLTPADWSRRSANPAWGVKQLMWHLASGVGITAFALNRAKKGKGVNPPILLLDLLNTTMTRAGSLRATPKSVARMYDAGHAKMLAALDGVRDDQWTKGATVFGVYRTVEEICRMIRAHWDEHSVDIRARR